MFICRHVLLRAYTPRHVTIFHTARRSLSCALPLSRPSIYAASSSKNPPREDDRGVRQDTDAARDDGIPSPHTDEAERRSNQSSTEPLLPPWLLDEAALQTEVANEPASSQNSVEARFTHEDPLDTYLGVRQEGGLFLRDFANVPHKIFEVLEAAATKRRADVIRLLVVDMVENGHFLSWQLRLACIERLLLLTEDGLLSKMQAITLFKCLQSFSQLTAISDTTKVAVSAAILAMPQSPEVDSQLLDTLALLLLNYINKGMGHTRDRAQSKDLSFRAIPVMYLLAYDLAALGLQRRSLDVLQALVKARKLSSYAMERANDDSGDYIRIVFSALIRSSISWGWRKLSSDLVQRVLPTMQHIDADVGELAVEVLGSLVAETTESTIRTAAAIIVQLMERCREYKIPQSIVQDFYVGARRHRLAELAEMVYSVSQSDLVRSRHKHVYLPPAKGTLLWFLQFLTGTQKNAHLPRVLAWQLVDENIPIAQQLRGPVIAILAGQGLATQARTLWERYAGSKEPEFVVGNASAMLRLVSLFTSLSKRSEYLNFTKAGLESAVSGPDIVDAAVACAVGQRSAERSFGGGSGTSSPVADLTLSGEADSENTTSPSSSTLLQADVTGEYEYGLSYTQVAERSLPEESPHAHALALDGDPKLVNEGASAARAPGGDLPVKSDPSLPLSAETTEVGANDEQAKSSGLSAEEARDKAVEFKDFAERVFNAFRRSRSTLKQAHHWELNAMARASFMLGQLEKGLDVFKHMFRTHQVPDLQDINVAVGFLAEYNPTAAANVIERMVRMGVEPDAVTFGSVIHHATLHGDMPLTSALIRRARELGITQLSYKTVGTLLRAAVALPDEDGRLSPRAQLQHTRDLVDSLLLAGHVPSPNMGRDCVVAALRADDPGAAFRFWQLLMKDKTEWDDESQAGTRQLIARRIRKHYDVGQLGESKARLMLQELQEPFHASLEGVKQSRRRRSSRKLGD
ncbi:hypothetical protein DAEQUDRAFT_601419 [Daedalea quercina L-15889]|uniref:Pentacotripeptide-repeat region of PRORP domain-containing protein n=1 Tax=Daedalea quercina L-15889 TaxID=1314783 RepID=A0A165LML3_9APHY|nr:hypothetical protein DAEQUDRAFT_601419 [Daedalea quercina L-15889]